MVDLIVIQDDGFSLASILILSNVASFHNKSRTFHYQKSYALIFLTLPTGMLDRSAIFNWLSERFFLLISVLSGFNG